MSTNDRFNPQTGFYSEPLNDPTKTYVLDADRLEAHRKELQERHNHVIRTLGCVWMDAKKGCENDDHTYYLAASIGELKAWLDVVEHELLTSSTKKEQ